MIAILPCGIELCNLIQIKPNNNQNVKILMSCKKVKISLTKSNCAKTKHCDEKTIFWMLIQIKQANNLHGS